MTKPTNDRLLDISNEGKGVMTHGVGEGIKNEPDWDMAHKVCIHGAGGGITQGDVIGP